MIKMNTSGKIQKNSKDNSLWDNSSLKVVFFASIVIVLSVFLTGGISYIIAKDAVISKLKSSDLKYIAQSIAVRIDGRITRAKETSLVLANDPVIKKWIAAGEKDEELGEFARRKIMDTAKEFDYNNSFIVSAVTNHYWDENGTIIDTMSKGDPDDSWFFQTISSRQRVSISIDYNNERMDTFAFINALVGDVDKPLAVAGVGLNFKDITHQFRSYKFGEESSLWLVDGKGDIYISEDIEQSGKNIAEFLPGDVARKIIDDQLNKQNGFNILEFINSSGSKSDMICAPLESTNWQLVLQIPRHESVFMIEAIKFNTGIACLITMVIIVLMFYLISNRIANPYRRAVLLAQEMEKKVAERTLELSEKNAKIMDSIEYARMIQTSILPSEEELAKIFPEHLASLNK